MARNDNMGNFSRPRMPSGMQGLSTLLRKKKSRFTAGALVRGVVIAAYQPDSDAPQSPKTANLKSKYSSWLFDVEVFEGDYCGILPRVPMATTAFGVTDMVQWVPRQATIDVRTGRPLQVSADSTTKPASITQSDGAIVIVAFLDNDYSKPIIIGALAHPETKRQISVNDSPQYKWQSFIRGNLIGIQDNGRVDIDITKQTNGIVTASTPATRGEEEPAADPTIKITTPNTAITLNNDGVLIEDIHLTKITLAGGKAVIEDQHGSKITVGQGINIETGVGNEATIGGKTPAQIAEAFVKAGAWDDMFSVPNGIFWGDACVILAGVSSLAGIPGVDAAARLLLAATQFATGFSTTGATMTTSSVKGE